MSYGFKMTAEVEGEPEPLVAMFDTAIPDDVVEYDAPGLFLAAMAGSMGRLAKDMGAAPVRKVTIELVKL